MFSKIIFVLATVCVINASMMNFKVHNVDFLTIDTEVASNPKDCNFQACEQLCRSANYISGACVNGRCKCAKTLKAEEDPETKAPMGLRRCSYKACAMCAKLCRNNNFINGICVNSRCKRKSFKAQEKVPEESLSSLEGSVLQQDDNDIVAETKKSNCYNQACDQLCRRLNFTGGACVNGRCQCDNYLNAEVTVSNESLSNLEDSILPQACRSDKCNELCIKLNLISGACSDGCCVCNKRLAMQDTMTDSEHTLPLRSCDSRQCDYQCRRSGRHGGVCIDGQCRCDNSPNSEDAMNNFDESISLDDYFVGNNFRDEVSQESLPVSELSGDPTKRSCDLRVCHQFCRSLNLPGGVCVNDRCKCDHSFAAELDPVEEYLEFATKRVCRLAKCNRTCTRRGYEGATCVKGRCKCFNITKTSLPVSELSEDPTERGCNMQACDQLCRRLKFPGGACVNGRCKCDNFLGIEVDAVDKNLELATRHNCDTWQCDHSCTRRGHAGGRCLNGYCECYGKINSKETSPLNDATSDENEESNEILSKSEKLRGPAPSICTTVSCSTCTVFCLAVYGP